MASLTTRRDVPSRLANAIFGAAALCFAAALAWALRQSALYPPGALRAYYLGFGAGAAVCVLALLLRREHKLNAALATLSALVALYAVSAFLTLYGPDWRQHAEHARASGVAFDTRSKFELLRDLALRGVAANPLISPLDHARTNGLGVDGKRLLPLSNISRELVVDCNESGVYSTYEADEHGFNNPAGVFSAGRPDVALLGDSFALGSCVESGSDIGGRLRSSGIAVVNLGLASDGPLLELATLVEYAAPLEPRAVFWLYFEGNDPSDLMTEQTSALLVRYLEDGFSLGLMGRQAEIDELLKGYVANRLEARTQTRRLRRTLLLIVKLKALRVRLGLDLPARRLSPLFADVLSQARDLTASWGGVLTFVYLPDWMRYGGDIRGRDPEHRERVLSVVEELEIPVIDLHEVFAAHPDPLSLFPFRIQGHYTSDGYALVADVLRRHLPD